MTGLLSTEERRNRQNRWSTTLSALFAAGLVVLTLTACGNAGEGAAGSAAVEPAQDSDGSTAATYGTEDLGSVPAKEAEGGIVAAAPDVLQRSIIRTGSTRVRVDDVPQAALAAAAAARGLGGLVAGEQTTADPQDPQRSSSQLTLRVPNARFDDLVQQVRGLGDMLSLTQQASDVTGAVADIDARVEAQRASVRRIQLLLTRAEKLGDVVTIEAQLAQRQSDLESLEAQQKALADQTALATLEVSIVGPDPAGTAEDPTGFLAGLSAGWRAFTDAAQSGLTGLGAVLPFVGFFLVVALPFVAWARSRERRTARVEHQPPPAPVREDQPVG